MDLPRPHRATRAGLLLATALTSLASPAFAAIYKCQNTEGRTTYQQEPCSSGAQPADIRTYQPSAEERDAAIKRGQQDKAAARELEREQDARRREALRAAERRRDALQKGQARCQKYLVDAEALDQLSQTRTRESERRRDQIKSDELRKRHFDEC